MPRAAFAAALQAEGVPVTEGYVDAAVPPAAVPRARAGAFGDPRNAGLGGYEDGCARRASACRTTRCSSTRSCTRAWATTTSTTSSRPSARCTPAAESSEAPGRSARRGRRGAALLLAAAAPGARRAPASPARRARSSRASSRTLRRHAATLDGVDLVLCGSSGASDLERVVVRAARAAGVRCAVWLDHWVNYPARFVLDGESCSPTSCGSRTSTRRGSRARPSPGRPCSCAATRTWRTPRRRSARSRSRTRASASCT